MNRIIEQRLADHLEVLQKIQASDLPQKLEMCAECVTKALSGGHKVLFCGNGGSAADSQHLAAEFVGRFQKERKGLPAIALTVDTSILTSVANDYGYETVFARQVQALGERGDVLIGISFPRYSMRTLKAMEFANDRRASVIAITDSAHSPMTLYSTCNLYARSDMVSIVDSLVAPLSVINAIVVALCIKAPDQIRKNLKMLESVWNDYQVYLNDEIDFIDDDPILNYSLRKESGNGKKDE